MLYADCDVRAVVKHSSLLNVVLLSVVMLNVIVPNVVAQLQDCEHPSTDQNLGQSLASKAP